MIKNYFYNPIFAVRESKVSRKKYSFKIQIKIHVVYFLSIILKLSLGF